MSALPQLVAQVVLHLTWVAVSTSLIVVALLVLRNRLR